MVLIFWSFSLPGCAPTFVSHASIWAYTGVLCFSHSTVFFSDADFGEEI